MFDATKNALDAATAGPYGDAALAATGQRILARPDEPGGGPISRESPLAPAEPEATPGPYAAFNSSRMMGQVIMAAVVGLVVWLIFRKGS